MDLFKLSQNHMIIIYQKIFPTDICIGIEQFKIKQEELNTILIDYKN